MPVVTYGKSNQRRVTRNASPPNISKEKLRSDLGWARYAEEKKEKSKEKGGNLNAPGSDGEGWGVKG